MTQRIDFGQYGMSHIDLDLRIEGLAYVTDNRRERASESRTRKIATSIVRELLDHMTGCYVNVQAFTWCRVYFFDVTAGVELGNALSADAVIEFSAIYFANNGVINQHGGGRL